MTESVPKKPNIAEISPHLICALCGGYLIDATTIVECLHSFCKTCIVRYLESSKYCPICEVLVHKTRPLQNIRLDQTLQNIVYKLVPGLFQGEMRRRREFYKDSPTVSSAKTRQEQQRDRIIYTADENFSISLEYSHDGRVRKPSAGKRSRRQSKPHGPERRYLLCPAATTVALLRKFIRLKFALPEQFKVELFHTDGPLRDHYSLMDVAYIYSWKREGVLQFYYAIYKKPEPAPVITVTEIKEETPSELEDDNLQKADDTRPSSLFSKASLLGNHSMDGHHDLSPLELIATVANDISCLQEGRGIKRKPEVAQLYENDEDNSSTETQIKKTVERAIDLCSSNVPASAPANNAAVNSKQICVLENKRLKTHTVAVLPTPSQITHSANVDKLSEIADNRIHERTNTNASHPQQIARETGVTKTELKDKPKKTDTASQCESRPKKQKSECSARSPSHSKTVNKPDNVKPGSKTAKDNGIASTTSTGTEKKFERECDTKSDASCDKKLEKGNEKRNEKVHDKKMEKGAERKPERANERAVEDAKKGPLVKHDKSVSNCVESKPSEKGSKSENGEGPVNDKNSKKQDENKSDVYAKVVVKTEPVNEKLVHRGTNSPLKVKETLKVTPQINGHSSPSELAKHQKEQNSNAPPTSN